MQNMVRLPSHNCRLMCEETYSLFCTKQGLYCKIQVQGTLFCVQYSLNQLSFNKLNILNGSTEINTSENLICIQSSAQRVQFFIHFPHSLYLTIFLQQYYPGMSAHRYTHIKDTYFRIFFSVSFKKLAFNCSKLNQTLSKS